MKKTLFFILLLGFIFSLLYVTRSPLILAINKILAISIFLYWLSYVRTLVIPIHLSIYLIFIYYSLFAAFLVSANMDGVLPDIKTMLQLVILLIIIFNISLYLNLQYDFIFISKILLLFFLLTYFGETLGLNIDVTERSDRLTGITRNANALGSIVLYGLISSIYLLKKLKKNQENLNFYVVLLFLIFFTLLLPTGSRKSLLGFVALFVFYLLREFKNSKKNILKLISLSLFILVMLKKWIFDFFQNSIMGLRIMDPNSLESGTNIREELYSQGIVMFLSNPFFGIGLNNFRFLSETGHEAHSYYMEILADTGLIGFILLFSVYVIILFRSYKLSIYINLRNELDFVWSFLAIVFVMSFGFTSHKNIVHWLIVGFIFLFLEWKKITYKQNVKS